MSAPYRVLFVCHANLCRSVTAAEYARRAAASLPCTSIEWVVDSAGTHAAPGNQLPPRIAQAMRDLGIANREHPVPINEANVRDADLILTAERAQRAIVAQRFPFAVRHTFTLLQFARLLTAGRAASPSFAVRTTSDMQILVQVGRSRVQPADDITADIPDPVRVRTTKAMLACAQTIREAVETIVR